MYLGLSKQSHLHKSVCERTCFASGEDVGHSCEPGRLGQSGPEDSEAYAMTRYAFDPVRDSARCL